MLLDRIIVNNYDDDEDDDGQNSPPSRSPQGSCQIYRSIQASPGASDKLLSLNDSQQSDQEEKYQ